MSRASEFENREFSPVSSSNDTTSVESSSLRNSPASTLSTSPSESIPKASPDPLEKFNPNTHKKISIYNVETKKNEDIIVPNDYEPARRRLYVAPESLESEEAIRTRVKTEMTWKPKQSNLFFKKSPEAVQTVITTLQQIRHPFFVNQALLVGGSQLSEPQFNRKKDLDLEWMILLGIFIDTYSVITLLKQLIMDLTGCDKYHEGDSWLLCKITWPDSIDIDLKINFAPKDLTDKIAASLAARGLSDRLWDITHDTLINYSYNSFRFVCKNPTPEDCAYALLKLALNKEKLPKLSENFVAQIKQILEKKDPHIENQFWFYLHTKAPDSISRPPSKEESLRTPIPLSAQKIIDSHMQNIKDYINSYELLATKKFSDLKKSTHQKPTINKETSISSNPQGFFAPPPLLSAGEKAAPKKISYASITKGNNS